MQDSINKSFNHLKIHTQYSICEGATKIDELKEYCKSKKIKSLGISDTSNLCGSLEFSESLSSVGTQPIVGTQIFFKYKDHFGLVPLIAKNQRGYKNIIELSSKSYLENDSINEPHCNFEDILINNEGIIVLSGSINSLIGTLYNKGLFDEISNIYKLLSKKFNDNFYIEIQRHNDINEKNFEKFNLEQSKKLDIPIIATNEVYYLDQTMHEAHDALMCIGLKTYVNETNRNKFSNQHYLKSSDEMIDLFRDLPEALENNFNLPYKCSYRPLPSKPMLPNISEDEGDTDKTLLNLSIKGMISMLLSLIFLIRLCIFFC